MKIKVITLNCWLFQYFDAIKDFLAKENPDIILLQEATSGISFKTNHGLSNGYELLRQELKDYSSVFHPMRRYEPDQGVYWFGHAIFSKLPYASSFAHFYLDDQIDVVVGNSFMNVNFPGLLLGLQLNLNNRLVTVMTTHFIWSMHPEINDRQRLAVRNLRSKLAEFENLIIGGDFNVTDDSEIYQELIKDLNDDRPLGIKRTLHPEIHKLGTLKDLAVDYLFHKSDSIKLIHSSVPILPLSDHLPVIAEYEII